MPDGPDGSHIVFDTPIVGGAGGVFGKDFEHFDRVMEYYGKGCHADPKYQSEMGSYYWSELRAFVDTPEFANALKIVVADKKNARMSKFQAAELGPVHDRVRGLLKTQEQETFAKIIMGELPPGAFDDFVETWKKSGGDELTKEVNDSWRSLK